MLIVTLTQRTKIHRRNSRGIPYFHTTWRSYQQFGEATSYKLLGPLTQCFTGLSWWCSKRIAQHELLETTGPYDEKPMQDVCGWVKFNTIELLSPSNFRGQKPPHTNSRNTKKHRVYTNCFEKFAQTSTCFLLIGVSNLVAEVVHKKTCSDELFYFGWIFCRGGFSSSAVRSQWPIRCRWQGFGIVRVPAVVLHESFALILRFSPQVHINTNLTVPRAEEKPRNPCQLKKSPLHKANHNWGRRGATKEIKDFRGCCGVHQLHFPSILGPSL